MAGAECVARNDLGSRKAKSAAPKYVSRDTASSSTEIAAEIRHRRKRERNVATHMIVDLDIKDVSALDDHRRQAAPILVRLGIVEVLEGEWEPKRLLVLEFQTMDTLKRWWISEGYRRLISLR
jgi:uncharacterized protein (DUF1330 family)